MRFHQPTIDYVTRRTAEGLAKRDIIRCLKRFLAREIYQRVMTDHQACHAAQSRTLSTYRGVNALAETVVGLYKTELIRGPGQGPWHTIEDVELATLDWVHWHNTDPASRDCRRGRGGGVVIALRRRRLRDGHRRPGGWRSGRQRGRLIRSRSRALFAPNSTYRHRHQC